MSFFSKKNIDESALESIQRDINRVGDVSLGSDIEMLWLRETGGTTEFHRADSMFTHSGVCGTDGRSIISELRITPAFDVEVMVDSMREVLQVCKDMLHVKYDEDWDTNTTHPYGMGIYPVLDSKKIELPESIGTHIHFGNRTLASNSLMRRNVIASMDAFLSPVVWLFEPSYGHYIRSKCGFYGDLSEYRNKPYGVEYKSLPCFLDDKDVFAGIFAIAKALSFEVISGNITEGTIAEFAINKDDIRNSNYLRIRAKRAHLFIKKHCRFYYVYKNMIDKVFNMCFERNAKGYFSTGRDVFECWDIELTPSIEKCTDHAYAEMLSYNNIQPINTPIPGYKFETSYLTTYNKNTADFYAG